MSRRHAAVRDTALPLHILAAPGTSAEVRRLTDELAAHLRELRDVLTREAALRVALARTQAELARTQEALRATGEVYLHARGEA